MSEPIYRLPPFTIHERFTSLAQTVDWGHNAIGVNAAWQKSRGKGARVAVLDTGVQADHPDLLGQIEDNETVTDDGILDGQGHGSHCCGIIAAIDNSAGVVGVATECRIGMFKCLDNGGSGAESWIARAVRRAVALKYHIISMSLGGSYSRVIHEAIKEAVAAGVIVIAAAGNSGPGENTSDYPGSHPECVSVGAIGKDGKLANFSSRGKVDVAAPGVMVLSTVPGNKYATMSGTSMATPYVAGVAALVVGACLANNRPIPSPERFKGMLKGSSIDYGKIGFDTGYGWGLVDPEFLIGDTEPVPPVVS